MSVIFKDTRGWLLDQLSHLNKAFQRCVSVKSPGQRQHLKCVFKREYFNIFKPHIISTLCSNSNVTARSYSNAAQEGEGNNDGNFETIGEEPFSLKKKRKRKLKELNKGEVDAYEYHAKVSKIVFEGTKLLVEKGFAHGILDPSAKGRESERLASGVDDNCLAGLCEMAKQLPLVDDNEDKTVQILSEDDMTSTEDLDLFSYVTENISDCARLVTLMGQEYLIPPRSSFLLADISCIQPLVKYNKTYDVIVLDPPWENKSVKRSNRYNSLPSCQIKQIPIPSLAAPDCLVVTWVTNRQKHLQFVKEELYPYWSIEVLAEWQWVKITKSGEFVFPLESPHKKPYEILVLGRYKKIKDKSPSTPVVKTNTFPDCKLIISVPSTLHSQKPSLADVLKEFVDPEAKCLELFARNLQPGWTSWGNEVLKFQHLSYFNIEETWQDPLT
ncbi:N(6)-adenine-specific methyltransferase METTL4 isoform X3 [Acipenser oxyrinchus oxyrinchus]|uniref:N(6)-adenine-specific methyltransferase METTL4 isoform X3 n=1 Tax=Acipenser oxyrinchus oxyrinchus TaxID=40147 RepID=A0AAD8LSX1_ACIOX|nr:N(6)-adenine-specific methyltransferase METTL4 isoform X3 [Acipenser oxyrinchus oxyrinchus]